jgi:hypothetical protein
MGGKPSKGTPADRRLTSKSPSQAKPAPMSMPKPKQAMPTSMPMPKCK